MFGAWVWPKFVMVARVQTVAQSRKMAVPIDGLYAAVRPWTELASARHACLWTLRIAVELELGYLERKSGSSW